MIDVVNDTWKNSNKILVSPNGMKEESIFFIIIIILGPTVSNLW